MLDFFAQAGELRGRLTPMGDSDVKILSGARARRVIDPSRAMVPEHAHDWPVLSLFVLGAYRNLCAEGVLEICCPSAVLYAPGAAHANEAAENGFEQVEIEFDPVWLGPEAVLPGAPAPRWIGGAVGARARDLARTWNRCEDEAQLQRATRNFLSLACAASPRPRPPWLERVQAALRADPAVTAQRLAADLDMHAGWVGEAYLAATGEGVRETATRLRVETAARLLRETDQPGAEIAIEAEFCDQSHMIRAFRRTLGRRPSEVREDRVSFRQL